MSTGAFQRVSASRSARVMQMTATRPPLENRQRVGTPSARARQHPRRPVGAGSLRIVTAVKRRGFAGGGRCSGDS